MTFAKRILTAVFWPVIITVLSAQEPAGLKPWILIGDTGQKPERTVSDIKKKYFMDSSGFEIIGEYRPGGNKNYTLLCITHPTIKKLVAEGPETAAPMAVVRLGIFYKNESLTYLSVPNMEYWGPMLFQDQYSTYRSELTDFMAEFTKNLPKFRKRFDRPYGSVSGLEAAFLAQYKYPLKTGFTLFKKPAPVPTLDERLVLGEFDSYEAARDALLAAVKKSDQFSEVYSIIRPRISQVIVGLDFEAVDYELKIMEAVDNPEQPALAFWPWPVIVSGNTVFTYHPDFYIPAACPDINQDEFKMLRKNISPGLIQLFSELLK